MPSTNPQLRWFGRIDYNVSANNRLTLSIMQQDFPSFGARPACPVNCDKGDTDWYDSQLTDVWSITPTTVNEFRFGFTRQGNWYTPESIGQGYPQKLGWNYAVADLFPVITANGVGGTSLDSGPNAIYAENSFDHSDTLTMIRGQAHSALRRRVLYIEDNDTPWGNVAAGNFTFSGMFTQRVRSIRPVRGPANRVSVMPISCSGR